MLAGVAALLVLAVIAGLVALGQRGKARDEATAADAQRLGARALVEPELDRSLLLARQGVALDDTVQTRGNLLAALLKSPAALSVFRPTGQSILSVALSPDDRTLTVGDDGGNLTFYDARTRRRLATLKPRIDRSASPDDSGTYALAYSPDGRRLAVAQGEVADQRVTVLDARTPASCRSAGHPAPAGGGRVALLGRRADARRRAQRLLDATVRARPP